MKYLLSPIPRLSCFPFAHIYPKGIISVTSIFSCDDQERKSPSSSLFDCSGGDNHQNNSHILPPPNKKDNSICLLFVHVEFHTTYTFLVPLPGTDLTAYSPLIAALGQSMTTSKQHKDPSVPALPVYVLLVQHMGAANSCSEEGSKWAPAMMRLLLMQSKSVVDC